MKVLVLLFAVCLGTVLSANTYTTKYDNIDVDEILNNQRLYKKYFECFINKGRCTADGREIKAHISDALITDCVKCSPKQKEGTEKVINFLLSKKPDDYSILESIYDPESVYRRKHKMV